MLITLLFGLSPEHNALTVILLQVLLEILLLIVILLHYFLWYNYHHWYNYFLCGFTKNGKNTSFNTNIYATL